MKHDCVIAGSGPAGSAAAAMLARRGWSVALIDVQAFPTHTRSVGWVNARAIPCLQDCGINVDPILTAPVRAITFYNADLSTSITSEFPETAGHLVDPQPLDHALMDAARKAGVKCITTPELTQVRPEEESIRLELDNAESVEGKILLAADGSRSLLPDLLGVGSPLSNGNFWCAQHEHRTKPSKAKQKPATEIDMRVILGLGTGRGFGYVHTTPNKTVVGLAWPGTKSDVQAAYVDFAEAIKTQQLVPTKMNLEPDQACYYGCPAGGALEMDSHVGKRFLAIGDAGGFLSAVSNEAIFPSLWSADLAVQVVDEALRADRAQDALAQFDTLWRTKMADYLRMPNTDIRFLWPLVFSNQQMADKMAAAFLTGENI